ncbi:hypothetical protein PGB90_000630 [Kerria lacca]
MLIRTSHFNGPLLLFFKMVCFRMHPAYMKVSKIPYRVFSSRISLPTKINTKMKIEFTCKICNTRNEKYFSKTAYTSGVVIIKCDGCHNNHLIADNLKWFSNDNYIVQKT